MLSDAVCTNREETTCGGKNEGHRSTHTLIKLSPLSTGDKSFAVWVPGYAGQTVFVGLRHFGPQLPRLAAEEIGRPFREEREREKNKTGKKKWGGRETQGGALSKGGVVEQKRRRRREEVSEYKQPLQYLWEPLGMFIFSKSSRHFERGGSNLSFVYTDGRKIGFASTTPAPELTCTFQSHSSEQSSGPQAIR